ncbi:MAG: hypothetical protein LBJ63_00425 [Prevotellaceae bacterium]|jgi:16S rRNA G1207 methylase RsmC|nr:hypothetical protein [Prevotellaceae bacterium]
MNKVEITYNNCTFNINVVLLNTYIDEIVGIRNRLTTEQKNEIIKIVQSSDNPKDLASTWSEIKKKLSDFGVMTAANIFSQIILDTGVIQLLINLLLK